MGGLVKNGFWVEGKIMPGYLLCLALSHFVFCLDFGYWELGLLLFSWLEP
jgi:hypothetical protein